MSAVTIWDVAVARGVQKDEQGRVNGAEFERLGLPMLSGCQQCHATLGPGNACPGVNGFIWCDDCVLDHGFETVAAFEAWCKQEEEDE